MSNLEIAIGERIKSYRKKREITQEQLAEYLNISFQSVSKWECGDAYPDITMLPKIALFFGITTDELLCIDKLKEQEEISGYRKLYQKAVSVGDNREGIAVMREANAKFPGNFRLMSDLVSVLYAEAYSPDSDEQTRQNSYREIISIGEKILAECRDNDLRYSVIPHICFAYRILGDTKKAIALANENLCSIYNSKEIALERLLDGDEDTKQRQENMLAFFDLFFWEIENQQRYLLKDVSYEYRVAVYQNILNMYFLIFKDGDFGRKNFNIFRSYMGMAEICSEQGDYTKALENIKNAAGHAVAYDNTTFPLEPHTSPLVNKIDYVGHLSGVKNYQGNEAYNLLKKLCDEKYDPMREMPEFAEICENLKQHAKENE